MELITLITCAAVFSLLLWIWFLYPVIKDNSDTLFLMMNNVISDIDNIKNTQSIILANQEVVITNLTTKLDAAKQRASIAESKLHSAGISVRTISRKK